MGQPDWPNARARALWLMGELGNWLNWTKGEATLAHEPTPLAHEPGHSDSWAKLTGPSVRSLWLALWANLTGPQARALWLTGQPDRLTNQATLALTWANLTGL